MAKRLYADVSKFKVIEHKLREIVAGQQEVIGLMRNAKANPHERLCLDRAIEECEKAIPQMRMAQQRLYDAFDSPTEGKK